MELVIKELLNDALNLLFVILKVFRKDEDVILVNYTGNSDEVSEDVGDKLLVGG